MLRLRISDDQNTQVPLFPLARAVLFPALSPSGWSSGVSSDTRSRLRRAVRGAVWSVEMAGPLLSSLLGGLLLGVFVLFGLRPFGLIFHTPAIVAILTIGVLLAQVWRLSTRSYARRVSSHLLAERLCPSCGYPLPESTEAMLACPECGAHWATERIGLAPGEHPPSRTIRLDARVQGSRHTPEEGDDGSIAQTADP